MADLHVLHDLGHSQPRGAEQPCGSVEREEEHCAATELQLALHLDDPADVRSVTGAAGVQHLLAEGVELAGERLDLLGREVTRRVGLP